MECTIRLEQMEFHAFHGCYDLEQKVGNHFTVDVTLTAEIGDAARHDDVEQTINYVAVYQLVEREMKKPSHITEHVALRILDALFATFPALLHAEITVGKLAPPAGGKMRRVAVTLAR